jgi:hypothetical protein
MSLLHMDTVEEADRGEGKCCTEISVVEVKALHGEEWPIRRIRGSDKASSRLTQTCTHLNALYIYFMPLEE